MIAYVGVAPVAAAFAERLPRRPGVRKIAAHAVIGSVTPRGPPLTSSRFRTIQVRLRTCPPACGRPTPP
jgi:hypothetical protein